MISQRLEEERICSLVPLEFLLSAVKPIKEENISLFCFQESFRPPVTPIIVSTGPLSKQRHHNGVVYMIACGILRLVEAGKKNYLPKGSPLL